jgi:ribosomal protein S2
MKRYVFRRTVDGIHIIHLGKTWEKQLGKKNETDKPMA